MEFPRLVYKSASKYLLTETEAGHAAALSDGWFASVPEALAGVSSAPPTRAELEQKATELKLKFDGRTTDKKLAEAIEAKLAEKG